MTDEEYPDKEGKHGIMFLVAVFSHCYWAIGSVLGYMVLLRIFWFALKKWLKIRGCNHRLTNCPCGFLVCNGENAYDKNIKYAMRMAGGGAYDISG